MKQDKTKRDETGQDKTRQKKKDRIVVLFFEGLPLSIK